MTAMTTVTIVFLLSGEVTMDVDVDGEEDKKYQQCHF